MAELPGGTVTLLFTDVEGSTRLLQRLGAGYAAVLERQRALLREACAAHGGQEVDTQGDALFVAFPRADAALAAAAAAQRALAAYAWPDGAAVRVRMGLHTGEPLPGPGGGYVGLDVHRAARIGAAAHGGQVLLSQATRDLVDEHLPPGAALRDLGEHRLKDLQRPERLYQLVLPDLPADFPPLRTLDRHAHNLPVQPTPLVGRERAVAELVALLGRQDVRLVTLTGPGGIGKTRLGVHVAADLADRFADGVFLVALAPLSEPGLVASAIARALGLREAGERPGASGLRGALREREVLLLLDNFEQVTPAADLVADLLAGCPRIKALVTSRSALHLRGEHEYAVAPLELPDPEQVAAADASTLARCAAVALFVARARAVRADLVLTDEAARAVAEICARLDGLPLAIELAAARVKLLPPEALLARLSSRLRLLTGGPRDLPLRHQTLRGTIDWSHDLLDPVEQALFRRLAVFAGGWSLAAAEAVCPAVGRLDADTLEGLESLVDKSLARRLEGDADDPRFGMLETIREYARERLADVGASGGHPEAEALERAHAAYYLELAERAEPALTGGEQQGAWLARLEREHPNLRAALAWARDHGEGETGLRLAAAVWRLWYTHGYLTEGRGWLALLLMLAGPASDDAGQRLRARALYGAATLASTQDEVGEAVRLYEESLALCRPIGAKSEAANALNALGLMALHTGNVDRAAALCAENLALSRAVGDPWLVARALLSLGQTAYARGDYTRAEPLFDEALALMRRVRSRSHSASALFYLGHVARERGDAARASACYREALGLSRELGDKLRIARALDGLATLAAAEERADLAVGASGGRPPAPDGPSIPDASLAARAGPPPAPDTPADPSPRAEYAARLQGAAAGMRARLNAVIHPMDRSAVARATAALRAALGEAGYDAAYAAGRALALDEAIAQALEE